MKVPFNWLREFVDIDCSAEELAERLTFSGLETEKIETEPGPDGSPEKVLNIEVTPNRADCFSIIGIAREAAALLGKPLKPQDVRLDETGPEVSSGVVVQVDDVEACPRYSIRALSGIKVAPGPLWMRRRLEQCGVRPINNVVDITNYVMLEYGQPMHAFDPAGIKDGRIIVRRARAGERITTLEGVEHELTPEFLVIADSRGPVALAGVMGGESSSISESTRTVLLETACFNSSVIRAAAGSLGVTSESSFRFEHGVDIEAVEQASRRAAALIVELAGGTAARGMIDVFSAGSRKRRISCRFGAARKLLGVRISAGSIIAIFESLGLKVVERNKEFCVVEAPSFRKDIENEADLIEEAVRIYGLDRIPERAPRCSIVPIADDTPFRAMMLCRSRLAGLGLTEIMNYSFVSEEQLARFDPSDSSRRVILPRPISADQSVLRTSLLPQMCETLRRNCARRTEDAALFEMGRVFFRNENGGFREEERVAIGLMGHVGPAGGGRETEPGEEDMFLWIKGVFESLCRAMGIRSDALSIGDGSSGLSFHKADEIESPVIGFPLACFEKDRVVYIRFDGTVFGVLGLLNRAIRREWRMRMPVAVLEAMTEPVLRQVFTTRSARPIPAFPGVDRDVAMIVPKNITHNDVVSAISKFAPKELTNIRLFDIYHSKELGMGRKGMAYSLRYCSFNRTLTDEEVNDFHTAIKAGIRTVLNAEIREG